MGWKALKDHFKIRHIVQVTPNGVLIGSGYVSNLATINPKTGAITELEAFQGFMRQHYPSLNEASPDEIIKILATPDAFETNLTVYTYEDGRILEKQCEALGWPNITHDGCLMYENAYSTDKAFIVKQARARARDSIEYGRRAVADAERRLTKERELLVSYEAALAELNAAFPGESDPSVLSTTNDN